MARTSPAPADLEAIDQLESKVKQLVVVIERLRAEQTRAVDENRRLARDLEAARHRLSEIEAASTEVTALREERAVIRTRVAEMLGQIEALNL